MSTVTAQRVLLGHVGVDSGQMCLARQGYFLVGDGLLGWGPESARATDACVVATTGIGDGVYDVLGLVDDDGTTVGVEVVFILPAFEAAAAMVPEMGENERQTTLNDLWDGLVLVSPAEDGAERTEVGVVTLDGPVEIGDPCYRHLSLGADLVGGDYDAVVFEADLEFWGRRVVRMGLYRRG